MAEPNVIFTLTIYDRPAMSRAVQSTQIREVLRQCALEFGGHAGNQLKGQLFGPHDLMLGDRPLLGSWAYEPSAPP